MKRSLFEKKNENELFMKENSILREKRFDLNNLLGRDKQMTIKLIDNFSILQKDIYNYEKKCEILNQNIEKKKLKFDVNQQNYIDQIMKNKKI